MKFIFQVNGRERILSEKELTAIIEKHFAEEAIEAKPETQQVEETIEVEPGTQHVEETETEEWFEVNPLCIDSSIFEVEREDKKQEETRQLILQALDTLKRDLQKYGRPFETLIPEKTWLTKSVVDLITLASDIGDHNANWIELAFEWAQRICNGASWESICNEPDTAKWHRLVRWKYGVMRMVGGSAIDGKDLPASKVGDFNHGSHKMIYNAVPLVVRYKQN